MDERRYEELTRKRDAEGLSQEAEQRGATPAEAQEQAEAANRSKDIDDSVMTREGHPGREQDNPPVA